MRQVSVRLTPSMNEWAKLNGLVASFCKAQSLTNELRLDLQLVCEEWFTNIVVHGYEEGGIHPSGAAPIDAELRLEESDEIVLTFRDGAGFFNPLEREKPDLGLEAEERPIGGLGIHLIRAKMDNCSYARTNDRNVFAMRVTARRMKQ
ncbi:ATP-binding protein [Paenibacillus sacheonensis]|uniref:Histidine kinase/HSP90-like ATPase domain-containing protein n=1 Tax=Paenibacillus sacheonensis TaxID=742054 RepID=A0A7X4YN65_9BACL|nr:ATP-binding protein [Paenibacillus sacheonensis]MBM7568301.1 anti-sigma regulatory factor (Ser/Thr protein kinase) [Paenibacillus sacheonensis]NBC68514.1 hypothetical protein [Paenibacillus sacheonensis]